jgi:hypothetical protein
LNPASSRTAGQAGARGGVFDPGIETFEAGRQRGQSECATDAVEIDVDDHRPSRNLVHSFEPDA